MLTTSLIGRKVLQGWDGGQRGTIVAAWADRGIAYIAIESPVTGAHDDRLGISVEELNSGTLLAPDVLAAKATDD